MCDLGDDWQARLNEHFAALAGRRSKGQAVFGLEHGLAPNELMGLDAVVRAHASSSSERQRHWLLWIVHASELGYRFAGDEYWQTFQRETPGWDDESRGWIRIIFRRFDEDFRGPEPSGAWADSFRIIAWPITNAILPTDLQRHLARALYEVRGGLAAHLEDPEELGRFIADGAWHPSDRFDKLTQQPHLLGQIALALLRPKTVGDETILGATLDRIARDLEKHRQAAAWLKQARRSVEHPSIRVGGPTFVRREAAAATVVERVSALARTSSPRVFLRQVDGEGMRWSARLRLPFLGPLMEVSPDVRDSVLESRCWVPAANAPVARGRLAFESQEIGLVRWPAPAEPLIRFQGLSEGLEAALLDEWAMPDSPWLFTVKPNGTAEELLTRQTRPGASYLLATDESSKADDSRFPRLQSDCDGLFLRLVRLPEALTSEWVEAVRSLGLVPTRSVLMRPVGFAPAEWDGESRAQWLASDPAMLGMTTDHPVEELECELEGRTSVIVSGLGAGQTALLQLPELSPGSYSIRVVERSEGVERARGAIQVEVRAPRSVRADHAGPLIVWADPFSTSLERLWEGTVAICVGGVDGQGCRCRFTLAERPGGDALATTDVGDVRLPLMADGWRALFRNQLQSDQEMVAAYDQAGWGQVVFDAGKYGRYTLEFDRQLPPVRWRLRNDRGSYVIELRDDTESGRTPKVQFASFEEPDRWLPVDGAYADTAISAAPGGGLYVARVGGRGATTIVPPAGRRIFSLQELSIKPRMSPRARRPDRLKDLAEKTQVWGSAVLPGNLLARTWRSEVVKVMQADLFSLICGPDWRKAEFLFRRDPSEGGYRTLQRMVVARAADSRTVAGSLIASAGQMSVLPLEDRIAHFRLLTRRGDEFAPQAWQPLRHRYGEATSDWLAEFCLRAASDARLVSWAGDRLLEALDLLLTWPLAARTARCVVLWSLLDNEAGSDFPPLFPGWDWNRT